MNLGGTWGPTIKARHVLSLAQEATLHAPRQTWPAEPLAWDSESGVAMRRSRCELELCVVAAAMPCSESAGTSQPDSSGDVILAAVCLPSLFFFFF